MKATLFVNEVEAMEIGDITGKTYGDILPAEVKALVEAGSIALTNGIGPGYYDEESDRHTWHPDIVFYELDTPLPQQAEIKIFTVVPQWYIQPGWAGQTKYESLNHHLLLFLESKRAMDIMETSLRGAAWFATRIAPDLPSERLENFFTSFKEGKYPVTKFQVLFSESRRAEVEKVQGIAKEVGTELELLELKPENLAVFTDWRETPSGKFGREVCNLLSDIDCARFLDWLVERKKANST